MIESGYFPVGAEYDPKAPWNQKISIPHCPKCGSSNFFEAKKNKHSNLFNGICRECWHKSDIENFN